MVRWIPLTKKEQVSALIDLSQEKPCVIFKHSTRCSVSAIAKYRLENAWDFEADEVEAYFLDLIAYREVSNFVSAAFSVYHESPQVLLIRDGECICDVSHLDISVDELRSCFPAVS